MYKSFKVRVFPNNEQVELMWKHFHTSRFIWNYMISLQQQRYKNGEKHLSGFEMNKEVTILKKDDAYSWLRDVSSHTLYRTCADLDMSYKKFFNKKAGYPKFKSRKKSNVSFPLTDTVGKTYFTNEYVNVPVIGKMKYKTNYDLPLGRDKKICNPRLLYINNKWLIYFNLLCDKQVQKLSGNMGIDLGVKDLAIVSYNSNCIIFPNINKGKRIRYLKRKLKHLQRNVSRKYKTNKNYDKTKSILKIETQIKEICYHISNIRKNYIHQITHYLVSLNPQRIVMEDLNVKGMIKNRLLSSAIKEQCLSDFIAQMEFKSNYRGIEFIKADRFYPSSKTCSCCGNIKKDLKLSDRIYRCNNCGLIIDRDYNAAINLMNYSI